MVREDEYLLIVEAETVQDYLQLFVNFSALTKFLPEELKLRTFNLLMPEVEELHSVKERKKNDKRSLSKLIVKVFSKDYDQLLETEC